jgi:MoxR-like ATPase
MTEEVLDTRAERDVSAVLDRLGHLTDERRERNWREQPDLRDGSVYRCTPDLVTALRVALVTGRPLLLFGSPGSGKSSIAAYVARNLDWRYYEHVVTARTEAQDLLWRFDLVRRLADANVRRLGRDQGPGERDDIRDDEYVEPGVLWWALDPASARRRGSEDLPEDRWAKDPYDEVNKARDDDGAVVLIDELDKADPDVPSGLLVPLGSLRFRITDTGAEVEASRSGGDVPKRLVVITTNEERDLPAPFVRRCITHRLKPPDADELVEIADRHLSAEGRDVSPAQKERIRALARRVEASRPEEPAPGEHVPSTAEFLDAVRAVLDLGDTLSAADWALVEQLTLTKGGGERA